MGSLPERQALEIEAAIATIHGSGEALTAPDQIYVVAVQIRNGRLAPDPDMRKAIPGP